MMLSLRVSLRTVAIASIALSLAATSLPGQLSRRDSLDVKKKAQRAQAGFERVRRAHMPIRYSSAPQVCDAKVGRFCQWNDDEGPPPKEPKPITTARGNLLAALDSAAARLPGDDWIAGQRIRYLVEAGQDSAALQAAASCVGTPWWCAALKGLALHESANYAASDTAFKLALSLMPEKERCRWTDVSMLLDDDQRKRFGKVGCGRSEQLAQRIWWLADPFLAIPGNERETEHYSRQVMSRILDGTDAGYTVRWGDDLRELVIRYGWSRYWTRSPGPLHDPDGGSISGHEASPTYHFFPETVMLDSVTNIGDSTWNFRYRYSAERYSPPVAKVLADISPQIALFRRGDSVQVVAGYDVSRDTAMAGGTIQSALVLTRDEHDTPVVSMSALPRGWHTLTVDGTPHLLSLEAWSPDKHGGARIRRGVALPPRSPNGVAVSDVLLFDATAAEGTDFASILPYTLGSLTVDGHRKLGLYWEAYGLSKPDSALPVSLTLTRIAGGTLRRLAEAIGLGQRSTPLSIAWHETPSLGGIATRSVVLDLSLIPQGRYKLKLELTPSGGPPVTALRVIEIQ